MKAHDGVDVPAPPQIEAGAMMHNHAMAQAGLVPDLPGECGRDGAGDDGGCARSRLRRGRWRRFDGERGCSGLRGRERDSARTRPGADRCLQVGDGRPYGDPRMAAMGSRPGAGGSYDPSVMPTSVPPAQVAMQGPGHDRPHIISHLLGLPKLGQIRREREEKEREKHAAIAYDQPVPR